MKSIVRAKKEEEGEGENYSSVVDFLSSADELKWRSFV